MSNKLETLVQNQTKDVLEKNANYKSWALSNPDRDLSFLTDSKEIGGMFETLLPMIAPASPGLGLIALRTTEYVENSKLPYVDDRSSTGSTYETYHLKLYLPRQSYMSYYPTPTVEGLKVYRTLYGYITGPAAKSSSYSIGSGGEIEIWPNIDHKNNRIAGILMGINIGYSHSGPRNSIHRPELFPLPHDYRSIKNCSTRNDLYEKKMAMIRTSQFPKVMKGVITDILEKTEPLRPDLETWVLGQREWIKRMPPEKGVVLFPK